MFWVFLVVIGRTISFVSYLRRETVFWGYCHLFWFVSLLNCQEKTVYHLIIVCLFCNIISLKTSSIIFITATSSWTLPGRKLGNHGNHGNHRKTVKQSNFITYHKKIKKWIHKTHLIQLRKWKLKNRDFRFLFDIWFSISAFHFEPYTQKRKLGNTETLQKGYNT